MEKKPPVFLLTTVDNPYNPFTEYLPWYHYDQRLGYDTPGLLARLAAVSGLPNDEDEEAAMREVVRYNFSGKHVLVTEDDIMYKQNA